jgi:hypothetical protein
MEVLLAYLVGVGTVIAVAKQGERAKGAVAWTARHVGAISGRVAKSLEEAARTAREEYERGRQDQLGKPLSEGLEADRTHHVQKQASHLNEN